MHTKKVLNTKIIFHTFQIVVTTKIEVLNTIKLSYIANNQL